MTKKTANTAGMIRALASRSNHTCSEFDCAPGSLSGRRTSDGGSANMGGVVIAIS